VCIGPGVSEYCHGKFRLAHKLINFVFASFFFVCCSLEQGGWGSQAYRNLV